MGFKFGELYFKTHLPLGKFFGFSDVASSSATFLALAVDTTASFTATTMLGF
jgi:hypothetical protein